MSDEPEPQPDSWLHPCQVWWAKWMPGMLCPEPRRPVQYVWICERCGRWFDE